MIADIGTRTLATGESLTVRLLTCPEPRYADTVAGFFLEHKPDWVRRIMRQQLRGDYAAGRTDKYVVGEVGGRIVGALHYGFGASGVGSFAHVYTSPEHRRKGIARALTAAFVVDFKAAPVAIVLSGTGTPWVADFYRKHGFEPGPFEGSLLLMKHACWRTLDECIRWYFPGKGRIRVHRGGMEYDHDAVLLAMVCRMRGVALGGDPASGVGFHAAAVLRAEDGHGAVTVAETEDGHLLGWAYGESAESSQAEGGRILNWQFHPDYPDDERRFLCESMSLTCIQEH